MIEWVRNPRAQLGPLFRPMLTQMYVGGVMACTHGSRSFQHASLGNVPVTCSQAHTGT